MIQFLKDNLDRQLQFLGLIIGFYALMILNYFIVYTLVFGWMGIILFVPEYGGIGIWLATIFQTWVIIKYIMKK